MRTYNRSTGGQGEKGEETLKRKKGVIHQKTFDPILRRRNFVAGKRKERKKSVRIGKERKKEKNIRLDGERSSPPQIRCRKGKRNTRKGVAWKSSAKKRKSRDSFDERNAVLLRKKKEGGPVFSERGENATTYKKGSISARHDHERKGVP